ncbi:hypothetical protein [Kitasatospora sp. LaBMicrA B282]|uniref:hypothetical protein n=1 Tax=Kitasatospora sp. LaBMicrA B282 TaxID=3420949 RepID=UPI003D0C86CB
MRFRTPLIAAPVLVAVYGAIRLVPGSREPGPGWLTGHTALLAALLLFVPVLGWLGRGAAGRVAAGIGLVGLACSVAQTAIDLYVGAAAADKADQNRMFEQIQAHPGVLPVVYTVGPLLFYVGLLAVAVVAAVHRRVPYWTPLLLLAGTVAMAASLDLLPLGGALYLLAFRPAAGATAGGPATASGTPVRVA